MQPFVPTEGFSNVNRQGLDSGKVEDAIRIGNDVLYCSLSYRVIRAVHGDYPGKNGYRNNFGAGINSLKLIVVENVILFEFIRFSPTTVFYTN